MLEKLELNGSYKFMWGLRCTLKCCILCTFHKSVPFVWINIWTPSIKWEDSGLNFWILPVTNGTAHAFLRISGKEDNFARYKNFFGNFLARTTLNFLTQSTELPFQTQVQNVKSSYWLASGSFNVSSEKFMES